MRVRDYFCEFFEVEIKVPLEAFDKPAFLEDIKDVSNVERKTHSWAYGSLEQPGDQHSHIYVDLRDENIVRITMRFFDIGIDKKDVRPPYMEDCGQWLGKFLRDEELSTEVDAVFRFDKGYSPVVALPFPLTSPRKELKGSQIMGISVQPPRKMNIRQAIIQKDKDDFTIFVQRKTLMNIRRFDLKEELGRLLNSVMTFVYKKGDAE